MSLIWCTVGEPSVVRKRRTAVVAYTRPLSARQLCLASGNCLPRADGSSRSSGSSCYCQDARSTLEILTCSVGSWGLEILKSVLKGQPRVWRFEATQLHKVPCC